MMSFTIAKGLVAQKAETHYPAPVPTLIAVEEAARSESRAALDIERKRCYVVVGKALIKRYGDNTSSQQNKLVKSANKATERAAAAGAGIVI